MFHQSTQISIQSAEQVFKCENSDIIFLQRHADAAKEGSIWDEREGTGGGQTSILFYFRGNHHPRSRKC